MDEILKTIIFQIVGYLMATIFTVFLFGFWMRGYFFPYISVRTSLGKKILVKFIEPTKIRYFVGKIEEGNLMWGKLGKSRCILNDIKREYIYKEQNIDCVDVDATTYAFIPKTFNYVKPLHIPADADMENYRQVFDKDGNSVIVTAIEGFDAQKIDSFVQAAQMRPMQILKIMQIVLILVVIGLLIGAASAIGAFVAGDKVSKADAKISSVNEKAAIIQKILEPPKAEAIATGGG